MYKVNNMYINIKQLYLSLSEFIIVITVRCRDLLTDEVAFVNKYGNKTAMEIHIPKLRLTKWHIIKLYVNYNLY